MAVRADIWAPVPGYEGIYEASWYGNVRKLYKNRDPRVLSKYDKKSRKNSPYQVVKLTKDGKSKEVKVSSVIFETFAGKPLPGYSIAHRDMVYTNNEYGNLILLSKEELGKLTGASSRRKPVMKLSADYEPIETYSSAREAARENYMSYQTVMDRCNHKVKNPIAPDGCIYIWDEEYDYEAAA